MKFSAKLLKQAALEEGTILLSPKGTPEGDFVIAMVMGTDSFFWYDGRSPVMDMPLKEFQGRAGKAKIKPTKFTIPNRLSGKDLAQGGLDKFLSALAGAGAPPDSGPVLLCHVWAPEFYPELGYGASRTVFKADEFALKLNSGADGVMGQNRVEWETAKAHPELPLNRPLKAGPRYEYLVTPLVKPFDPKAFRAAYGCDLHDLYDFEAELSGPAEVLRDGLLEARISDYEQPANWGTLGGEPVLLDFGIEDTI